MTEPTPKRLSDRIEEGEFEGEYGHIAEEVRCLESRAATLEATNAQLLEALREFVQAEQEYTDYPDAPAGYRLQSARAKARAAIKAGG